MDGGTLPCLLVENKIDLLSNELNIDELRQYGTQHGFIGAFGTSAKTGANIEEAMRELVTNIIDRMESMKNKNEGADVFTTKGHTVILDREENSNLPIRKKKECC